MRVLLVQGGRGLGQSLKAQLRAEGYGFECADNGADALDLIRHYPFDLVLIELNLPDIRGAALISRLRTAGHHTPIVAIGFSSKPGERLAVLSAGADDVVEHMISQEELFARMRAIVRRSKGHSQPVIRVDALALDLERQIVTAHGKPVHLTSKEFALLRLMTIRKNTVMTKEAILSNLYGGLDEPDIKIVDVFICKIRAKLAKAGLKDVITTVWGRGYSVSDNGQDRAPSLSPLSQPVEIRDSVPAFA